MYFTSCNKSTTSRNKNVSAATGWSINSKKGGFKYNTNYKGQETPPNMVLIEGGTYTKGKVQDDPMKDWNNTPNQQHVQSFYMDQTEVTNIMYLEYLDWLKRYYPPNLEEFQIDYDDDGVMDGSYYSAALPDTLVWRNKLGYSEDMVNNYLRHPAFEEYPVVGVNWIQAVNFSNWRSDRYQELLLEKAGYLSKGARIDSVIPGNTFSTDTYLLLPNETYGGNNSIIRGKNNKQPDSLLPVSASRETGVISPKFRLPTESEWEYAAIGLVEVRDFNLYRGRKKYPWQGQYTRTGKRKNLGDQLANFKNSDGDYGGIAGWSDDGADITNQVRAYEPNDFGLYDMAGNVAEWVQDVYRPIIDDEFSDFNYFRGNVYNTFSIGADGKAKLLRAGEIEYKTLSNGKKIPVNLPGDVLMTELDEKDTRYRTQYNKSYNVNFRDGDLTFSRDYEDGDEKIQRIIENEGAISDERLTRDMYNSPKTNDIDKENDSFDYDKSSRRSTLISDKVRVYKGGSWKDRAYWLDPAQRRFYPEDQATDFIGFRCAMSRVGKKINDKKSRN